MRRLLAIRPGAIGDCILSFPALESLRARCDYLEIWAPRAVTPLIHFADRVRAISSTGLDLMGIPSIDPPQGLFDSFQSIVTWYGTNRPEFRQATLDLPMEFHAALPPMDSPLHATDFFCQQLTTPPKNPRIPTTASKRDFIAIHPFSGSPRKNWPLEHFETLATALPNVEWCVSPETAFQHPALREDDLGKLAHWLAQAKLYIGNDSGITHLAAAVGTPTIAIFQASNPKIWAPRGPHVRIFETPTPENILQAILLNEHPHDE